MTKNHLVLFWSDSICFSILLSGWNISFLGWAHHEAVVELFAYCCLTFRSLCGYQLHIEIQINQFSFPKYHNTVFQRYWATCWPNQNVPFVHSWDSERTEFLLIAYKSLSFAKGASVLQSLSKTMLMHLLIWFFARYLSYFVGLIMWILKILDNENWQESFIMITCPCNEHPFTPHFCIVKVGFTGIYIFFFFLL